MIDINIICLNFRKDLTQNSGIGLVSFAVVVVDTGDPIGSIITIQL